MKLKFSNGAGDESEININGKCQITDYDPRTNAPGKDNLTIKVDGKNASIMNGTELQQDSQTVTMNAQKYSIFTVIAGLNGNKDDLDKDDIEKAKECFNKKNAIWYVLNALGVTDIRYDSHAGVATIVYGDNQILRIDFETLRERLGITADSSKQVEKNPVVEEIKTEAETETESTTNYKTYDSFVDAVAYTESRGNVSKKNRAGYVGLFQIGEQALADLGIYVKTGKKYNNNWKGKFKTPNKYGISSLSDFKNSADKQKMVFEDLLKKNWEYIQTLGLDQYIGKTINGHKITESGLLAGAHLVGVNGLKKYLNSKGTIDVKDGNGVSVSVYIDNFAECDVSNITGAPMGTLPPEIEYVNISYTVIDGDNLSKIAKKYNTSIDRIREASKLKSDSLKIGQVLTVPEGRPVIG